MNCAEFRERHSEIVEGRALPLVEARLRAHARACGECGRILDEALEFRSLVGEAVREGPSLDWNFTRRVIDALPKRPAQPAPKSAWRRAYERAMPAFAAAALVVLCVALALAPARPLAILDPAADFTLVIPEGEGRTPILGAALDELRAGDVIEAPPFDVAGLSLSGARIGLGPRSRARVESAERLALTRGQAAVRTASSAPGLVIDAAGAAIEIEPGSLVRIDVTADAEPRWTAEVAEGGIRSGGARFGPGTRARVLGTAGLVGTALARGEIAAIAALTERRPERESSRELPSRDERPSALDSLLAGVGQSEGDIARDATLARLGDAAAALRVVAAAQNGGEDSARALAALTVLSDDARRGAGARLAGCAPTSPESVSDLARLLASADPVAAERTLLSWIETARLDRSLDLAAEADPTALAAMLDTECRSLLAALRLANDASDPDGWLESAREAEERLERLLLATLAMTRDPRHLDLWNALLEDPDPRRRELGARGLRFIADPESADVLLAALERAPATESESDERVAIVAALADLRRDRRFDPRIATALETALHSDADARVRRFAARGIALRHEFAGKEALETVLAHEDHAVRVAAAEAAFSSSTVPVPEAIVERALRQGDTMTAALAVTSALLAPSPAYGTALEAIVRDRRHDTPTREMALDAWALSGATAADVAGAAEFLLAEEKSDSTLCFENAAWSALAAFPLGSAAGRSELVAAARRSLLDPSKAMTAARALRTLGSTEIPAELAAARDAAVGDDRLYFAVALLALGDDASLGDVLYRIDRRQPRALAAVSWLRGLPVVEPISDALADLARAADSEVAFGALRGLAQLDPGRAEIIARERHASAVTASDRLDAALVLYELNRDASATVVEESILEDGVTLALVARRLEISEPEARARVEEWSARPSRARCRFVTTLASLRAERGALSRSLAADERTQLERRVRRIESCLLSLDATRARFLTGLSAEAAYGRPDQRRLAVAALAAMSDSEADILLSAMRDRGDAAVRAAIESTVGLANIDGSRRSPRNEAARAALHDWIERTPFQK